MVPIHALRGPAHGPRRSASSCPPLVLVALVAAACGVGPVAPAPDDGDGPPGGSPSIDLLAVSPAPGAEGVPVDAVVSATFTAPVDPASVDDGTFRLVRLDAGGETAVTGALGVTDGGRRITLRPAGGLTHNAHYRLAVGPGLRPAGGGAAFAGSTATFATARATLVRSDPAGDTFAAPASDGLVLPDLVAVSATQGPEAIEITLGFAEPVDPRPTHPRAVGAYVDLDVDQDGATGETGLVEGFRPDAGRSGLGVEAVVELRLDGAAALLDVATGDPVVSVPVRFDDAVVRLTVPYEALGDARGNVDLAVVVGTRFDPTDVAPDDGALRLGSEPR